jgi:hypothetical protein
VFGVKVVVGLDREEKIGSQEIKMEEFAERKAAKSHPYKRLGLMGGEGVGDAGRIGCAGEDRVDAGEGFGDGKLDGRRKGVGESEVLSADGEKKSTLGNVLVKLAAETQEEGRRAGMREQSVRFAREGAHSFAVDEAGGEAGGGVEENGKVATAERIGEFGSPLLGSVEGYMGAGELIAELAGEMEGDGVVAA